MLARLGTESPPAGPFRQNVTGTAEVLNLTVAALLDMDERVDRIEREHGWDSTGG